MRQEDFLVRLNFVLSFVSIIFISFSIVSADEIIKKIEIDGLYSLSREEFLYLLGTEEGKTIKRNEINRGIKRLFLKNLFDDIVVNYSNQILKVQVMEKPKIDKIEIVGNKYFPENFYKKFFKFKLDERFSQLKLRQTTKSIEYELSRRGFSDSKVSSELSYNKNVVYVRIYIDEGTPLKIKKIIWEGTFDEHLISFLSLSENDPLDKVSIEDFIKNCKKYLEKMGFVGSFIRYSFKDGDLYIYIDEGVKLEIDIKGSDSIPINDLKNIIMAHFQDKINDYIIRDSLNSLIIFYRSKGFIDIKIVPLIEKKGNQWNITYIVNEGDQRIVERILMKGTEIPIDDLKRVLMNKEGSAFNFEELNNDRQRIEEFLKTKGFYNARISAPEIKDVNNKVEIVFNIEEGIALKISSIEISVKDGLFEKEALESVNSFIKSPFNELVYIEIKRKIREIYLKKGYPEALVDSKYEISNEGITIKINVNPGNKKYFGRSIILGNKKTKTNFIYQRLIPKENMAFNPNLVDEERQNLYKTGLFSRIDIYQESYNDSIDLIYSFEEIPAGVFEFGFGYGEYEKAKGFIEFSYINLFGTNKQIFSRAEISNLEKRIYFTYVDPWLWSDLIFKSSLLFERMDVKNIDTKYIIYKIRRYGTSVGFEKKFFDYFKGELLYEVTYSKLWDVKPEVIISDKDIGEIFISGIKASIIYDTRDYVFDPTKGWLAGVTSKLSNEFLGSEINFLKTSFYINKYTELTKGIVLATSFRGGWAWLYGNTKELPISERYFLGGRDSVRGYAQNTLGPKRNNEPTGGNAFLMGNFEFRTSLGKNFYLINFLDFGNLWNRVDDVDITKLKYTAGIGLRYKTPVGPLRIDYGHKLNRDKGESKGEIHFSIGHAF